MVCSIAPPKLLEALAAQDDDARRTLELTAALRARRAAASGEPPGAEALAARAATQQITVYDVAHGTDAQLPGTRVRATGEPAVKDAAVNEAYDGAAHTAAFYADVYERAGIDGHLLEIVSSVHYGTKFENAMWDGRQMVYGDGGGQLFAPGALTTAIDVIAHELTHGVTQYTAKLEYSKQSGALNESFSDVFGSMVKQYLAKQISAQADWLIGAGLLLPNWGKALRSMKAPGTAWSQDDQPATMSGYQDLPDDDDPAHDNGGVHVNSGIPNRAFYLAATALGGHSWERAGRIWYETLTKGLEADAQFADAANATVEAAGRLFDAKAADAVREAWTTVEVL